MLRVEVATGAAGVVEGGRVRRYVDLSTIGSSTAVQIHDVLAERNIVAIDSPVSGGVGGAENGTLAMMVSGAARRIRHAATGARNDRPADVCRRASPARRRR